MEIDYWQISRKLKVEGPGGLRLQHEIVTNKHAAEIETPAGDATNCAGAWWCISSFRCP